MGLAVCITKAYSAGTTYAWGQQWLIAAGLYCLNIQLPLFLLMGLAVCFTQGVHYSHNLCEIGQTEPWLAADLQDVNTGGTGSGMAISRRPC